MEEEIANLSSGAGVPLGAVQSKLSTGPVCATRGGGSEPTAREKDAGGGHGGTYH